MLKSWIRISFSLSGEDRVLWRLFKHQKHGFYIDAGCSHPVNQNNLYRLYLKGWRGINIDPELHSLYKIFRRKDKNIKAFLSDSEKTIDLYNYKVSEWNTSNQVRIEKLAKDDIHPISTTKIKTRTLKEICIENSVKEIDILDVDCEGEDLKVLQGHNWEIKPKVILVEEDVGNFLFEKGYTFIARTYSAHFWGRNDLNFF